MTKLTPVSAKGKTWRSDSDAADTRFARVQIRELQWIRFRSGRAPSVISELL